MKFIQIDNNICCKDVLQSVFELNNLDFEVYNKLREMNESRADVLAKKMNKERSTIYRSLQKLTLCKLCVKKTKTIDTGGYYHIYSCNDLKKAKEEIGICIDKWYSSMKVTLDKFEKELG